MAKQRITETFKPDNIPADKWDAIRVKCSFAELQAMGAVREYEVDVPDPDPDLELLNSIREKSLKGNLTAKEISDHALAEIRCKAKGLIN